MAWIASGLSSRNVKPAVGVINVCAVFTKPHIKVLAIIADVFNLQRKLQVPNAIHRHSDARVAGNADAIGDVCIAKNNRVCNSRAGCHLVGAVVKRAIWVVQELATPWAEQRSKAKHQLQKEIVALCLEWLMKKQELDYQELDKIVLITKKDGKED